MRRPIRMHRSRPSVKVWTLALLISSLSRACFTTFRRPSDQAVMAHAGAAACGRRLDRHLRAQPLQSRDTADREHVPVRCRCGAAQACGVARAFRGAGLELRGRPIAFSFRRNFPGYCRSKSTWGGFRSEGSTGSAPVKPDEAVAEVRDGRGVEHRPWLRGDLRLHVLARDWRRGQQRHRLRSRSGGLVLAESQLHVSQCGGAPRGNDPVRGDLPAGLPGQPRASSCC